VYNDRRSLSQLPADAGYRPAAFVLSRVVSLPGPGRYCLDAGHKTVSADAGDPTCVVLGRPGDQPVHPSEEHLPVELAPGATLPARGELFWLLPSHVCPTVNNFDHAVTVAGGSILGVERVTARGRHPPG
jgi:D-serine deaminase-like pyridoxal phosphate-dependent protein